MNIAFTLLIGAIIFAVVKLIKYLYQETCGNPFEKDDCLPIKKKVIDQKKRDAVLKQGFNIDKVAENLDAIVIGSGIGGLAVAAILSKIGKKVLVLEQHDQAGGCCHTYIEKGYEFDVGIHYVGDMIHHSLTKTFVDQISDGQIQWEPMDRIYDRVVFKEANKEVRSYDMISDLTDQIENLKKHFPDEKNAIDKYYKIVAEVEKSHRSSMIIKFIPLWLVKCLEMLHLTSLISSYWSWNKRTVKEVVDEITDNQELRDIFCYCFGDYGTEPSRAGFPMQAVLMAHFLKGGAGYPIGGASEIAFHIIPVIERGGGQVLVRARVEQILLQEGVAKGVKIKHGQNTYNVSAPIIISDAGAYNTLSRMLPREVAAASRLWPIFERCPQGIGMMSIFVGLNATAEELELSKKQNMWIFTKNDIDKITTDYMKLTKEECEEQDVPLLFLSFPSTKDPTWNDRYPGKSTAAIITLANFSWFAEWLEEDCKRRGDDYEAKKKTIAQKLIDHVCDLYPKIRDHIDFIDIGTPLSNNYYLGAMKGEVYGLDHTSTRFSAMNSATLRPKTDIPGLYLTGQDISSAGFVGGLYGGLLSAQQILGRNIMKDLVSLYKSSKKSS